MSWEDHGGTRRAEKAEVRWNTPSYEAVEHERNSSRKILGKLLTEPQFPPLCHGLNIYFVSLQGLIREPGTWHTQYTSATFSAYSPHSSERTLAPLWPYARASLICSRSVAANLCVLEVGPDAFVFWKGRCRIGIISS